MKYVYELTNDVSYESSQTLRIYSNEDSALRELAERFNNHFDKYKRILGEDWTEQAEFMKPTWGDGGDYFDSGNDSYGVHQTKILD